MIMTGADVECLRALATDFTHGAQELQQLSAELARAIDAADDWQGPDATRAKGQWGELARARMTGVAGALETAGTPRCCTPTPWTPPTPPPTRAPCSRGGGLVTTGMDTAHVAVLASDNAREQESASA
jgi:uncharacterized protein YukE